MRILFIVEHYYPYIGGAEELWKALAEHFVRENHRVTVLTTRYAQHLEEEEAINGVNVVRLNVSNRYGFTFFSLGKAVKLAKEADIVHTSSYNAALPARIASWITSTKCIITFHEVWGKLWFNLPDIPFPLRIGYYFFEKILLRLNFDRYVAVSDFTLNELTKAGVNTRRSTRIYNGLTYSSFSAISRKADTIYTFCYYGRLGLSKGYQFLLPAFHELKKSHPAVRLKLIVPKYPVKAFKNLKKAAADLDLGNDIVWLHDLDKEELYREVARSSAVVIPSLSEGFCFAAAEAVALNIPVISSQRGALKEVVGGPHITIKSIDVPGIYAAMESAIQGQWEYSEPRQFPLAHTVYNYTELYQEILDIKKEL